MRRSSVRSQTASSAVASTCVRSATTPARRCTSAARSSTATSSSEPGTAGTATTAVAPCWVSVVGVVVLVGVVALGAKPWLANFATSELVSTTVADHPPLLEPEFAFEEAPAEGTVVCRIVEVVAGAFPGDVAVDVEVDAAVTLDDRAARAAPDESAKIRFARSEMEAVSAAGPSVNNRNGGCIGFAAVGKRGAAVAGTATTTTPISDKINAADVVATVVATEP